MRTGCQGPHLQIRVHAQHIVALRLSKAPHNRAAETSFCCPYDDADVVAFAPERLDGLDRPVARVVVHNNHLDFVWADGGVDL